MQAELPAATAGPALGTESSRGDDPYVASRTPVLTLPKALTAAAERFLGLAESKLGELQPADEALLAMLAKLRHQWQQAADAVASGQPLFVFTDGPATTAIKCGRPLLLEGYDLPSQATTERLNPALETEPTFAVSEDIASAGGTAAASGLSRNSVAVPSGFFAIATVTVAHPNARVNISPATRSRFTVVHVPLYSAQEEQRILLRELQAAASSSTGRSAQPAAAATSIVARASSSAHRLAQGSMSSSSSSQAHGTSDQGALSTEAAKVIAGLRAAMAEERLAPPSLRQQLFWARYIARQQSMNAATAGAGSDLRIPALAGARCAWHAAIPLRALDVWEGYECIMTQSHAHHNQHTNSIHGSMSLEPCNV